MLPGIQNSRQHDSRLLAVGYWQSGKDNVEPVLTGLGVSNGT